MLAFEGKGEHDQFGMGPDLRAQILSSRRVDLWRLCLSSRQCHTYGRLVALARNHYGTFDDLDKDPNSEWVWKNIEDICEAPDHTASWLPFLVMPPGGWMDHGALLPEPEFVSQRRLWQVK